MVTSKKKHSRINSWLKFNSIELFFDFGSLFTRVAINNKLLINQPSCFLLEKSSQQVLALGKQAFKLCGKEPANTQVIFPIKLGTIYDRTLFELYLGGLFKQLRHDLDWSWSTQISAIVFLPNCATALDKKIFQLAFGEVGINQVQTQDRAEAILANLEQQGVGSGRGDSKETVDFTSSTATQRNLIALLDIGDQLTEIVIGSLGRVAFAKTIEFGGNILTQAITDHLKKKHNLHISRIQAMKLKCQLPSLEEFRSLSTSQSSNKLSTQVLAVRGVSAQESLIVTLNIPSQVIGEVILNELPDLTRQLRRVFAQVKSEQLLSALENGLMLIGGGSLLTGLDRYLSKEMGLNVTLATRPFSSIG